MTQMTIDDLADLNDTGPDPVETMTIIYARTDYASSHDRRDTTTQITEGIEYARDTLNHAIPGSEAAGMRELTTRSTTDTSELRTAMRDDEDNTRAVTALIDTPATHPGNIEKLASLTTSKPVDHVIVRSLDDLNDTPNGIETALEALQSEHVAVHCVDDSLIIPGGDAGDDVRAAVTAAARSTTTPDRDTHRNDDEDDHMNDDDETHTGRPPIGYEMEDGQRVKADDYDEIRRAIEAAAHGHISLNEAARRVEPSRRSIKRAYTQRPELYDVYGHAPSN